MNVLKQTFSRDLRADGPVATAIRTQRTVISQDLLSEEHKSIDHEQALLRGSLSSATVPLTLLDATPGVLVVEGSKAGLFTPEVMLLLDELAGDLAFGINHLRSQAKGLSAIQATARGLDHAIGAIASMAELRDPYTAGHQKRVAALAVAIAGEMGLSEDRVQGLRLAALVHDVGKIQVPAEILSKPSKLSAAEYEIIKVHPQAAWEVLKAIEFPWPVAEIVYQHHEKLDGSGYPRGLKGDAILLESRILTVADEVEAMASHRPYRPSRGLSWALQEISRQKGTMLDNGAVEACIHLLIERKFTLNPPLISVA